MGDERQPASAAAAATAAPGTRTGGDPDSKRATASAAIVGGDGGRNPTGAETTPNITIPDGAGHSVGAAPETEPGEALASNPAPAEIGQGREKLNLDDLEFHCVRALRYHEARAAFLDLWRRLLDFAVILSGASAITSLVAQSPLWGVVANVATAAIGALQLVASLGDKAQEHRWVHRRYAELYGRVTEAKQAETVDPVEMRKLVKRWAAIWPDEGTTMHVLEAVAYNAAVRTLQAKVDPGCLITISPMQSFFRNIFSQEGFEAVTPNDKLAADRERAAEQSQT